MRRAAVMPRISLIMMQRLRWELGESDSVTRETVP